MKNNPRSLDILFLGAITIPIALTSQCQCRSYWSRITTINTSTLIRFSLPLRSPHIILYSSSKLVLVFLHKLKMVSGLSFLGSADRETEGEEECAGIFPFGSFAWNLHAANSTLCCKCIFYCMFCLLQRWRLCLCLCRRWRWRWRWHRSLNVHKSKEKHFSVLFSLFFCHSRRSSRNTFFFFCFLFYFLRLFRCWLLIAVGLLLLLLLALH